MESEIARDRIARLTPLLEDIYTKKKIHRMNQEQFGYIMEVKNDKAIIRPELHAPEVDEYDEVLLKNIVGKVEIGEKVRYTLGGKL